MRVILISLIGVSSIVFVIMIQNNLNTENIRTEELSDSLAFAMSQTMEELEQKNPDGFSNRNEMMALFLQEMLARVEDEISLSVMVHSCDYDKGIMDMEVLGEFVTPEKRKKTVTVRRCMRLMKKT